MWSAVCDAKDGPSAPLVVREFIRLDFGRQKRKLCRFRTFDLRYRRTAMRFSVIIATYNRAEELVKTLESLKGLESSGPWEVIIVDNNSSDNTCEVVLERVESFPVPLRYVMEKEQGRSAALNAGIRIAQGEILAITDDDVRVDPMWLRNAEHALERLGCDYVGGKALPIWSGNVPKWMPNRGGKHWGVIALLDYGPEPIEF